MGAVLGAGGEVILLVEIVTAPLPGHARILSHRRHQTTMSAPPATPALCRGFHEGHKFDHRPVNLVCSVTALLDKVESLQCPMCKLHFLTEP